MFIRPYLCALLLTGGCASSGGTAAPQTSGIDGRDGAPSPDDRAPEASSDVASREVRDAQVAQDKRPPLNSPAPIVCKEPGAYFCDDFELGTRAPSLAAVYGAGGGNVVTVDTSRPRGGSKYSLHVKSSTGT